MSVISTRASRMRPVAATNNVATTTRFSAVRSQKKMVVQARASDGESGIETQGPNMTAMKEIQEIMDILPHRYPFLLVDRVLEW